MRAPFLGERIGALYQIIFIRGVKWFRLGMDTLDHGSPRVEGTLGSMIASLHKVKKYLTLKVIG